jgi:glycosyltransferase involved in cell wall biosynthesis
VSYVISDAGPQHAFTLRETTPLDHRAQSTVGSEPPRPDDGFPSITAFFPAFNDVHTIKSLIERVEPMLSGVTDDYEVVVVDDGSTDGTGALLDELARRRPRLRVVHHPANRGYGAALRTGFGEATKEFVFYTDGDGQYDVTEITRLLPLMRQDVDVVNGYKLERADKPHRVALGAVYNRVASAAFRLPIRDVDCDFRLIRRRALRSIELESSSGAICVELVHKLHADGAVFAEAPVHHYRRRYGRSQFFTPRHVLRTAVDLAALWSGLVVSRCRSAFGSRRA